MGMAVENEKLIVRGTFHLDEKDLRVTRKKSLSQIKTIETNEAILS